MKRIFTILILGSAISALAGCWGHPSGDTYGPNGVNGTYNGNGYHTPVNGNGYHTHVNGQ